METSEKNYINDFSEIETTFNELTEELRRIKDLNDVTESYKERVSELGNMIETFLNKSYTIYNENTLKNKEIETKIISASSNAHKDTEAKIFSALSNTQKEIETEISSIKKDVKDVFKTVRNEISSIQDDIKKLSKKLRKNQIVNYLKVILLLAIVILLFLNNK